MFKGAFATSILRLIPNVGFISRGSITSIDVLLETFLFVLEFLEDLIGLTSRDVLSFS